MLTSKRDTSEASRNWKAAEADGRGARRARQATCGRGRAIEEMGRRARRHAKQLVENVGLTSGALRIAETTEKHARPRQQDWHGAASAGPHRLGRPELRSSGSGARLLLMR